MEKPVVHINPHVKRMNLTRGILSLFKHDMINDIKYVHVLFQNQLWLEGKTLTDPNFQRRYGSFVLKISILLRNLNLSRGFSSSHIVAMKRALEELESELYDVRNLPEILTKVNSAFSMRRYKPQGIPTKSLPPKKFLGKGYGDKGSARKPQEDGSPTWQEISSSHSTLLLQLKEVDNEYKEARLRGEPTEAIKERRRKIVEKLDRLEADQRYYARTDNSDAKKTKNF